MVKKTVAKREVEVSINPYELMLILNPELRESEVKKKLKEIVEVIEKAGGKITHEDFWDKKTLAYRIQKHYEGIYMVYNIELPNNFLNELKGHLRIEKKVLRSMILSLPADYTYTKYDLEAPEEKPKKREYGKKNISIKHTPPVAPAKPKIEVKKEEPVEKKEPEVELKDEEKEEKPTEGSEPAETEVKTESSDSSVEASAKTEEKEVKKEAKEKPKAKKKEEKSEIDEAELDKKLDEIIGGEDLNL